MGIMYHTRLVVMYTTDLIEIEEKSIIYEIKHSNSIHDEFSQNASSMIYGEVYS